MDLMLVDVHLDACRANGKKTFIAFAKVSDKLIRVVSTFLCLFGFRGGFGRRLFFILHLSNLLLKDDEMGLWDHLNSCFIL